MWFFDKSIKLRDLPEDIQNLQQIYNIEKLQQCGHVDSYIKIKNKDVFVGINIHYGKLIFTFNNDTVIFDTIYCYTDCINNIFPYPTDITIGQFIFNENKEILKLQNISQNTLDFLSKHNLTQQDIINELKQQFISVYFTN